MSETATTYSTGPDVDLLLTARDALVRRVESKDAALREVLWILEDYEITGLIDRVSVQAGLRTIKAALKS